MFSKVLKIFRDDSGFAIMSVGNLLSSVITALFYLYFATIVSVEGYGQVIYVISFALSALAISSLGIDTTIMTFTPKKGLRILHECYSVVLLSSLVATIITAILLRQPIAAIMLFSLTAYSMSLVELVTLSKYKEHALLSIGARVCQICLSLALFSWIGLDGFLLGYSISYLITGYRFFLGLKNFSLNFGELKGIWRFMAQVYGSNASYALLSYLDKIIVGFYFGYFILGSYQLAFQVYALLSIFPITLFNYILPHQARGSVKKRIKLVGFAFICGMVVLVVLLTPIMLPYLFPKYIHVTTAIQIIVFAIIPLTLVIYLRSNILARVERAMSMLYAGLISLTIETISIIVLGSLFGINGISSAMLLTMTVEFIFLLIANKGRIF